MYGLIFGSAISFVLSVVFLYYLAINAKPPEKFRINPDQFCFFKPFKADEYIKILLDKNLNLTDKTIFFLDSSCEGGLDPRKACAVESAAATNPDWRIIVLLPGPTKPYHTRTLSSLSARDNVYFAKVNTTKIVEGTEVEWLFAKDKVLKKKLPFPVNIHSEVLKMLIMKQFRGIFLDFDVIVTRSLNDLPLNFVYYPNATEDEYVNAVLGFSQANMARTFTDSALQYAGSNEYDKIATAESNLIRTTFENVCKDYRLTTLCEVITTVDESNFPVVSWQTLFDDPGTRRSIYKSEGPFGYNVHGINYRRSRKYGFFLFTKIASKYCPTLSKMYGNSTEYF